MREAVQLGEAEARARAGRVDLRWSAAGGPANKEGGTLRLVWAEKGGPPVAGPPARRGFGTRVVEATVRGQLGGTVERRWHAEGLVVEIAVPLDRAAAGGAAAARVPEAPAPTAA